MNVPASLSGLPPDFASRFLASNVPWPGDVPAWGEAALGLALPPAPVQILGLDPQRADWLAARYRFRAGEAVAGPRLQLWRADPGWFHAWDGQRGEYLLDLHHDEQGLWVAGWQFLARLDWTADPVVEIWTSETRHGEFLGVLENVLRILTAFRVLARGGVVLHSAGIQLGERAHLFWGRSGAGKSTLSRLALSAGHGVISDDLNVVLPTDGGFLVERVPFAGDLGQTDIRAAPLPLGGLHRLLKAPGTRREALTPARALAGLSACTPFVNVDPHRVGQLLDNLTALLASATADTLYFSRTGNPWSLLNPHVQE